MNDNYKLLFEASENKGVIQAEIIDNQKKQLSALTKLNAELTNRNQKLSNENKELKSKFSELLKSYNHATDVCNRQQELLDSLMSSNSD